MKRRVHLFLLIFFLGISHLAFSTHIVGGSLTYVYNGGSNYTITLKLYRDCSPGTAAYPTSVTITVLGYDGQTFTPSRDITMSLGTVTQVPSNLDTCATPPNPMPCTQEGIYTTTVNNLPPNPGGYHLYYQLIARNLTLTNVNAACNCVGESYYAYIPGPNVIWGEDFPLPNGTTVDNNATAWSIAAGATPPASASVNNNLFQITGANNAQETWTSQVINIAAYTGGVNLTADMFTAGALDPTDTIFVSYSLNGGPLIPFATGGILPNNFASAVASQPSIFGSTVQIVISAHFDAASPSSEIYRFDNVFVDANDFVDNSNPVFNLFPPLFLCVGEPFTFDHSATDINGDSLYYDFYTPYNGDNGVGPLDPTFAPTTNTATFTPIVFLPTYTYTNPLGPSPFNLNHSTGLLTGTPGLIGRFVVGVVVKEYRNGVYLSSTLRDFQFNVINCPTFAPAVLSPATSCNSNTVSFSNLGGSSGANWLWNFGDLTTTHDTSTLNHPSYTYPGPGTYTVSLTTGFGTHCANTATAPLVVSAIVPSFTNTAPACAGTSVTFTDHTTTANSTISSWSWNFGDTGSSASPSPTHIYTTAGTYTVTLSVTNNYTCTSTVTQVITINPVPIVNAGANQTVCGNNPNVSLTGTVTNATGGIWSSSGTGIFSPNATTLITTYIPSNADTAAGSVNLYLTSTGNNVCAARIDTMHVVINNAPTIANAGANQIICGTTTATLAGNTPQVGTGLWTLVSGTATITSPNSPTTTVTGLTPGSTYIFVWTISSPLCNSTRDSVTINVDLLPTTANAGADQILCMSTSTTLTANTAAVGSGVWSLVSGTATITSPTSPTSTVTGLVPGTTAVLRWTISRGVCNNFDDVSIIVNPIAVVNAGPNQVYCAPTNIQLSGSVTGGATTGIWSTLGSGTFTPNATTLNAIYVLSSADITNGNVTLVLTSTNNSTSCSAVTDTIHISYAGFNGVPSVTITPVSCFGGNNGAATVNVAGGVTPFTYFWNSVPPQSTQTAGNLTQGTYTVTITDGNGCTSHTTAVIVQPQTLSVNSVVTNVSCSAGNNGSIAATPAGGTAPFTYLWMPGNLTTATITNRTIGTYTLTVTDSRNCQVTATYTITQPLPLSVSLASTNVSCFGGSNGSINSTVTGGTAPFMYSWTPIGATSANISGLLAGTYSLTVTDFLGCTASGNVTITQPAVLVNTITSTNATCNNANNGTATVVASGGSPNYTYLWMPGSLTSGSVSGLAVGTYTLTTTDNHGCTKVDFVSITQPPVLTASFINHGNVSCFGGSNGSVTVNAAGGTPNYTYQWLPGNAAAATINNLQANTYTVTVTDVNGCSVQNSVTITQPASALSVAVSSASVLCSGGSTGNDSSFASGGTAPYAYTWMPGNIHTQNDLNVPAGTYTLTVTDLNGCTSVHTVAVTEPAPIVLTTSSVSSTCSLPNGQAFVTVSGGVGSPTFSWSPSGGTSDTTTLLFSGSYTVTATDANGCVASQYVNINDFAGPNVTIISSTNVSCYGGNDGSATAIVSSGTGPFTFNWTPYGGNSTTANGLIAGVYTLVVVDSNGCQSLATTSPAISQPPPLVLAVTSTNVTCYEANNGSAGVVASGGSPGYSYLWLPTGHTADTLNNLTTGNYYIQVTDTHSCVTLDTVFISEPNPIVPVISSTNNVSCFGGNNGSSTLTVTGGTPFYNYNWLPGGGNGPTGVGLSAGTYTVDITDFNGCPGSTTVVITQPALALSATGTATSTSCFNGSNGSATVNPVGGTASYSYQWSPSGGTSQTATGLNPGNYLVLITDSQGCQTNVSLNVNQPNQISISMNVANSSCGLPNGTILSQVSGGTSPYSYLWSPVTSVNANLSGVGQGTYTLQVTDSHNCIAIDSSSITNIPGPSVSISSSNSASCFGGSNGVAIAQASLGTLPYTISWIPSGGNNLLASGLTSGTYTVNVTDALGCSASATTFIGQAPALNIGVSGTSNVSCFGGTNGSISVAASGGTPNYSYVWAPVSSSSPTVNNLSAGSYTVSVLDQNSCTTSISVNVTQPTALSSSITSTGNPTCYNGTGTASVIGSGGTIPYTYTWATTPVQTGSTATNIHAGSTTVTITDGNGCTATNAAIITQPAQVITVAGPNDTLCVGSFGIVTATATGSSGYIYTWLPSGVNNSGSLTVSPTVNTTYTVTATDQNGCVGASTTVQAIVYTLAQANLSVSGATQVCAGASTTIGALVTNNSGPVTYLWNHNLGTSPGPITVSPTQPTTYIVTVTNTCGISIRDSVRITITPPPIIVITTDNNSICVPNNIHFNDHSTSGNPNDSITSWLWNFGDGTFSTLQNPTHLYSNPGAYPVSLTVTTTGGCTNNNASAPDTITAYPRPIAAFSLNSTSLDVPYDPLICTNQSIDAVTYYWNFGDGGTSTAVSPTYTYTNVGIFPVELIVTSQYGCKDTTRSEVTTNANVVFPNAFTPNSSGSTGGYYDITALDNDIFFPYTTGVSEYKLQIFNRWGELIFETFDIKQGWDGYYHGRLCQLDVYIWKADITFNNGKKFRKSGDVTLLR